MAAQRSSKQEFIIAAVGDVHGHFRALVRLLADWEKKSGRRIDLVLQVGDLEPHRHEADMESMSAPAKYRKLGDFHEVYMGRTPFPWPVLFIGGNHEPYGALDEHPEGYELCPNIIYLGRSGLHIWKNIRIVGLSGVAPSNEEVEEMAAKGQSIEARRARSKKAQTWFSPEDFERAAALERADILLLHEWPQGLLASEIGDFARRLRGDREELGSLEGRMLIEILRPQLVLCGHMHFRAETVYKLEDGRDCQIVALANLLQGEKSLAVFAVDEDGLIRRIEGGN